MPQRPLTPCAAPGCPALTAARFCPAHARQEQARRNARRPGAARSSLPRRVKRRDGERCVLCGRGAAEGARLVAHHVLPVARGGAHDADNLVTLCRACHAAAHERGRVDDRRAG